MSQIVEVTLGGQEVSVTIDGGNIGAGASVALGEINQAVSNAEAAAASAEQAAIQAGTAGATAGAAAGSAAGAEAGEAAGEAAGAASGAQAGAEAGEAAGEAVAQAAVAIKADKDGSNVEADAFRGAIGSFATRVAAMAYGFAPGNKPAAIRLDGYIAAGDGGGALYKPAVSEPPHAGKFQTADGQWWVIAEQILFPEQFGAAGGTDDTGPVQQMATAAPVVGARSEGRPGRVYNVSTVSWPSHTRARGVHLKTIASSAANCPFLIDGRVTPKTDILLEDCSVDGNRVNQTGMDVTPGDGGRFGFWLAGRVSGATLIRPKAWYCGTEGLFLFSGEGLPGEGALPSSATDYLLTDIWIIDPDLQWNGRHGGSGESAKGVTISGGVMTNNGKDMPGYPSGNYGDGGNARRTAPSSFAGRQYGRAWDWESYSIGTGFEDISLVNVDCRDNYGSSLLFHHRLAVGWAPVRNIKVSGCKVDAKNAISGGSSITFFAANPDGSTYMGAEMAFDGVDLSNNIYDRLGVAISSANRVSAAGGFANMTGPDAWFAFLRRCGGEVCITVPGINNFVRGLGSALSLALPFSFDALTQILGTTGTIVVEDLGRPTFIAFTPDGGYIVRRRYKIVTTGTGDALLGWAFTPTNGYAPTGFNASATNASSGAPVPCSFGARSTSQRDASFVVSTGSISGLTINLQIEMTCRKVT